MAAAGNVALGESNSIKFASITRLCEGVQGAGSFSPVKMRGYRDLTRSVLLIITVFSVVIRSFEFSITQLGECYVTEFLLMTVNIG